MMNQPQKLNDLLNAALAKNGLTPTSKKVSKPKLSILQLESLNQRLETLTRQFKKAIISKNLFDAKNVMSDLQSVLRTLAKPTKLVEFKNQFFELALDEGDFDLAREGFLSNRQLVSDKTRLHLEATALLAISYLRTNEIEKAKPFIKEVLQNKNVIKTESTREKFNKEIIARFDEECALFSLKSNEKPSFDIDELHKEAVKMDTTLTAEQLFSAIGKALPKSTRDLLFKVDKFSKNQLTYKEQKLLPSSEELVKDEVAGKTVFSAFKRVVYKSICDSSSEVYKIWYSNAVGVVVDKKYITSAIALTLAGQGIGISALLITAAALVMRFGLDIYCEKYKPVGITEIRRKATDSIDS